MFISEVDNMLHINAAGLPENGLGNKYDQLPAGSKLDSQIFCVVSISEL
jgi:hypothetical protein